jgi:hypothetical protein
MRSARELAQELKNVDREQLLNLIGLETRKGPMDWVAPALGAFAAGLLVGAGVGLLLAPRTGTELRDELSRRLHRGEPQAPGASEGSTAETASAALPGTRRAG